MQRILISFSILVTLNFTIPTVLFAQSIVSSAATGTGTPVRNSGIDTQWIDSTVRPQDNFFKFVSGKWLATQEIPSDRASYDSFAILSDLSEQRCHDLIDGLIDNKNISQGTSDKKIADLYASFMDEKLAEKLDVDPLHAIFTRVERVTKKDQLSALNAEFGKLNISVPINVYIYQDARDTTKYAVKVNQGGLTLPDRNYYLEQDDAKIKSVRDTYLKHVQIMLEFAGLKNAEKSAADVLALETKLARLQWSRAENLDPIKTYNKVSVGKLNELLSNYDWKVYLAGIGVGNKVDYVLVRQPSFIRGLNKVIKDTPLNVWKTYFKWKALNSFAPYLSQKFVTEDFAFFGFALSDILENKPRWKRGIAEVESGLPEALGKLYVEKYFPPENKVRMEQLVNNLIAAYRQSIESLSWMNQETKNQALIKLSKFTYKIGYPDKWRDYSKLVITKDDLVGNIMRIREFERQRQINKIGNPVDKSEWSMSPQTVNAYYSAVNYEIVFPAAILQPPFFNANADDAVNYGGIGATIGHEISHGYDDSGSQSDGDGNLRDWWTKEDKDNFKKLTSALVEQYNTFIPLPGYHVNGALTLDENIADNSGLSIAYKAYRLSLNGKPAPVIDGYTGDQRFYMGWAQVWRGKARDAEAIRLVNVDSHSPNAARGNLTLTNQPAFYSAFDVKENDQMYLTPDKRITIW